jgi:glycosyltransferase involved in cell wall biosynthesis
VVADPLMPSVSVVVASYGRGSRLAATLGETLANVDPAEVVVVDDGSTDDTPRCCGAWRSIIPDCAP